MTRNEVFEAVVNVRDNGLYGCGGGVAAYAMIVPTRELGRKRPSPNKVKETVGLQRDVVEINGCYIMNMSDSTTAHIEYFVNHTFSKAKISSAFGLCFC